MNSLKVLNIIEVWNESLETSKEVLLISDTITGLNNDVVTLLAHTINKVERGCNKCGEIFPDESYLHDRNLCDKCIDYSDDEFCWQCEVGDSPCREHNPEEYESYYNNKYYRPTIYPNIDSYSPLEPLHIPDGYQSSFCLDCELGCCSKH